MQPGDVIRKYRKLKNMTQEEMAARLGVTAPAVNKWENGNSYPDIMLLSPIARLLGITPDTLLCFKGELTPEEIEGLIREADRRLEEDSYEETFAWAKEKLKEYPGSLRLVLSFAQIFDARRLMDAVADAEKYDGPIGSLYTRALESEDEDIRTQAADALFYFYLRNKEYEKAEGYLSFFSGQNPDRKRKQAMIYSLTGRREEAYKACEELLFSGCQLLQIVFQNLCQLSLEDGDLERAQLLALKQKELVHAFDMGEYREAVCLLDVAAARKDEQEVKTLQEKLLANVDGLLDFTRSPLYAHMTFKEADGAMLKRLKKLRTDLQEKFENV